MYYKGMPTCRWERNGTKTKQNKTMKTEHKTSYQVRMEAFSFRLKARLDDGDTISSDSLFQALMMESWKEDLWWRVPMNGRYSGMEF